MCEELSLTGNNCTNRRHVLPGQETAESGGEGAGGGGGGKKMLPAMQHSSGVQYIAACNCGRTQANREDPFKLVDANYNFYQALEEECCKDLEHVEFPVYIPVKVMSTVPTEKIKIEDLKISGDSSPTTEDVPDINIEDTETEAERVDTPAEDDAEIILEVIENLHIDGKSPSKVASLLSRAGSKEEFLTTMKTTSSPPGVKPEFSSWSLILIGSSHVYSHSSGLGSQPGFMSSSKFLLPWEIPLTKISTEELREKWPNIVENAAKRASLRGPDEAGDKRISVKVFIGIEYECPRGHRFMISAPDKPMKSSSTMREAATKLVSSDLPLYMACPCRITKPPVAQLTRIHVVTPKAPIWITVNPQVQPSPGGPIFLTGEQMNDESVE